MAAAAVVAVAIAGCGGGGGTGTTTGTAAGAQATSTTAQAKTTGEKSGSTNPFGGGAAKGHTVADVLNAVLATGDPNKACSTDYVTDGYLTDAYGGKQGCVQAQTASSAAQSIEIVGLAGGSGESGTATVKVQAKGGVYDGEKLTVMLVRDGQDWKIDSLKSNAPVGP
jgi:hypothetical protein